MNKKSREDVIADRAWAAFEVVHQAEREYRDPKVPMHEKPNQMSVWFRLQDLLKEWDAEDFPEKAA